jgi:DNA repair exonuclease SbcCD ATPase subunit
MKLLAFSRIALIFGFVALFGFTTYLAQDDWRHRQSNRALAREAAQLQATLDTIENQHKQLIETIEREKNEFRDALGRLQKENEDLRNLVDRIRDEARQTADEKSYLEEILINKTKENERLRKNPGYSGAAWSGESADLIEEIKKKDKEMRTLEEQNRLLSEKLEKLYVTTNDKISEINVAKIALEETVVSAKQKIEEEWSAVNLGTISAKGGPVPTARSAPSRMPRSEGKVLAINDEHGFVVVDLGRVDNLKTQEELEVIQDGRPVATLSVLELRDVMAACNVRDIADGGHIQVNDPVSVRRTVPAEAAVVVPVF